MASLKMEQIWMQKLNTSIQNGMNKRTDILHPKSFVTLYNDHIHKKVQLTQTKLMQTYW